MRGAAVAAACALAGGVAAQNPDVFVRLDATLQYREEGSGKSSVAGYTLMGRQSTLTLQFTLEPGFDVVVAQRFQKADHDPDREHLDEYYLEDRGYWRVGKQYLPFGKGTVLRESVYAGRLSYTIGSRALPLALAYAEAGERRQKGFVARVGDDWGASVAVGRRWGIASTALTPIRRPEESPGVGRGYRYVFGMDFTIFAGSRWRIVMDHASFRGAETDEDRLLDVTDAEVRFTPRADRGAFLGITREWRAQDVFVRLGGHYPAYDGVWIEPFVRWKNGRLHDLAVGLRLKP